MVQDLERYLVQKSSAMGVPIRATLELTPACNMNCKMCYVHHTDHEIHEEGDIKNVSYWKSLIPEMKEMGILFISLIGGEPFLYPGLQDLYEELYKNGFYLNLTTNGTLLANGIPEWMLKKKPRYVSVSLYGANNETYLKVTGNPNGFTQTMQGIQNLLNAEIPVKLNYVIIPENMEDLEKILEIMELLKVPLVATSYCFPQVRRRHKTYFDRLTPEDCAKYDFMIQKRLDPEKYEHNLEVLSKFSDEIEGITGYDHYTCHAGSSTFWINWKGEMMSCGMIDDITIPTTEGQLLQNWNQLKEQVSNITFTNKCTNCKKKPVCSVCPAMMYAETGDYNHTPDYVCRITEEKIALAKRLKSSE